MQTEILTSGIVIIGIIIAAGFIIRTIKKIIGKILTIIIGLGVILGVIQFSHSEGGLVAQVAKVNPSVAEEYGPLLMPIQDIAENFEVKGNKVHFSSDQQKIYGEIGFKDSKTMVLVVNSDLEPVTAGVLKKIAVSFTEDQSIGDRIAAILRSPKEAKYPLENGNLLIQGEQATLTLNKVLY